MSTTETGKGAPEKIYTPEELRDPDTVSELTDQYADASLASWEIDQKVEQGVRSGLFVREAGDSARPDTDFSGTEVKGATHEMSELLHSIRSTKAEKLTAEKTEQLRSELDPLDGPDKLNRLTHIIETAVRRGDIDITNTPVGRTSAGRGPARRPRLSGAGREGFATVRALETLKGELSPDEKAKLELIEADLASRQSQLRKAEAERTSHERYQARQAQAAEQARAALEAADEQAKADRAAALKQDRDHGLTTKSTKAEREAVYEQAHADALASDAEAKAQAEVYQHYQALINAETDEVQKQRLVAARDGEMQPARERARAEATPVQTFEQKKLDEENRKARFSEFFTMDPATGKYTPTERMLGPATVDGAHELALAMDPTVAPVNEVYDRYTKLIDAETNVMVKKELEGERSTAVKAERERQKTLTKRRADILRDAEKMRSEVLDFSARREASRETLLGDHETSEDEALAQHQALGLEPIPFLEAKSGGWLHRRDYRGPRTRESYFRIPGNEHVVVIERRKQRNGELISQTIATTELPLKERGSGDRTVTLPPREITKLLPDIRKHDNAQLRTKGKKLGDYVGITSPFGSGDAFYGDSGVYAKYGADTNARNSRRYGRRQGGFWFWLANR